VDCGGPIRFEFGFGYVEVMPVVVVGGAVVETTLPERLFGDTETLTASDFSPPLLLLLWILAS